MVPLVGGSDGPTPQVFMATWLPALTDPSHEMPHDLKYAVARSVPFLESLPFPREYASTIQTSKEH
jgi:hypothetical protein